MRALLPAGLLAAISLTGQTQLTIYNQNFAVVKWKLWSNEASEREVEFSYLTGGMRWEAHYNAVSAG